MHKIGVSIYIGAWGEIGSKYHCVAVALPVCLNQVPSEAHEASPYARDIKEQERERREKN